MKFAPEFVKPEKNLCFLPNANCTKKQGKGPKPLSFHRCPHASLIPPAVSYTHLDVYKRQEHTRRTLIEAQERGVKIVLASGRPTYGVAPLAEILELHDVYKREGKSIALKRFSWH